MRNIEGVAVEYPLIDEFAFYRNEGGMGSEAVNFAQKEGYKVYKSYLIVGEEIGELAEKPVHTHNEFGGMIDCKGCHPENK